MGDCDGQQNSTGTKVVKFGYDTILSISSGFGIIVYRGVAIRTRVGGRWIRYAMLSIRLVEGKTRSREISEGMRLGVLSMSAFQLAELKMDKGSRRQRGNSSLLHPAGVSTSLGLTDRTMKVFVDDPVYFVKETCLTKTVSLPSFVVEFFSSPFRIR